ncbi:MAG: metallophosphoesterase family protein [Candidatus Lokiarchaeota archaeon]|nr:metallophosphoesterase family protein [Candidatus Lokiarchaeota archaeon]
MNTSNPRDRKKRIALQAYGIFLVAIGVAFIVIFYVFFAASNGVYFVWPYDYPQVGPTLVQSLFPAALGITMFAALLFVYVAISNFKRVKANKAANITAAMFAVLAISAGSVMGYFAQSTIPTWYYDAGPYLMWSNGQDPTTGITVCWHSAASTAGSVRYGTAPDLLANIASKYEATQFHHVRIDGLTPNTTYFYRVDASPFGIKQFTTAPRDNASFSIVVWSDPRQNDPFPVPLSRPNLPAIMASQVRAAGKYLAFSICTGDTTARGVDFETWKLYLNDISTSDFASNASHVVAMGNHERHDDTGGINLHKFYPYDSTTFTFTWGQLHCIVIDPWNASNPYWGDIPAATYSWLQEELARHASSTFKAVFVHPPPLNGAGSFLDGPAAQITRLCNDFNVTAVFSGHYHSYWRVLVNGTTYITNGLGGNANNGNLSDVRYCRVDITSTGMEISTINAFTGAIVDFTTITA